MGNVKPEAEESITKTNHTTVWFLLCNRMVSELQWIFWGIDFDLEIVMRGTGLRAIVQGYQSPTGLGCAGVVGPDWAKCIPRMRAQLLTFVTPRSSFLKIHIANAFLFNICQ